jgi:hypothetical protein
LRTLTSSAKLKLLFKSVTCAARCGGVRDVQTYCRLLSAPIPIIWIAAVSKSGSTWLRYMLFDLLCGPVAEQGQPERAFPRAPDYLGCYRRGTIVRTRATRCAFVKTHARVEQMHRDWHGLLVPFTVGAIYLYRNPKDICLSQINHARITGFCNDAPDDQLARMFLEGALFPGEGLWSQHVAEWMQVRQFPVLKISYEQLKTAPIDVVKHVMTFIGERADDAAVADAVGRCDFGAMRRLEEKYGNALGYSRPGGNSTRRFVNLGRSDQSLDRFGAAYCDAFASRFGVLMDQLGYGSPRIKGEGA